MQLIEHEMRLLKDVQALNVIHWEPSVSDRINASLLRLSACPAVCTGGIGASQAGNPPSFLLSYKPKLQGITRLSKDYENTTESSEAMSKIANIQRMLRRVTAALYLC
jgi:hypothetical protein